MTIILDNMRLPVICAPMFLISGPEMVIAACKSGIGAAFPTANCRTIEDLEGWIKTITNSITPQDGPWVLNMITHSSYPRLEQELELVKRYKPPIVITALGSPKPVIETVKSYGGLVFADVVDLNLAHKAAKSGVDGLACISAGAGGHTGKISPFAFISEVRSFFKGYIAVGGGISDGSGIAGAIAAGADCVYMGTRFLPAKESLAQEAYKNMVIQCKVDDLVISSAVTGTPASWLRPSLEAAGIDPNDVAKRDFSGVSSVKRWRDIWAAGQGLGRCTKIETTEEIVNTLHDEFTAACKRFAQQV